MENKNIDILHKFGDRIQSLRKDKKLSQEDFAHICGLHRTYIGMIERGEKNITLKNIEKLAKALNMDISEIMKELNG
ncbi:MAG: helix-turn-helix transcriptional regulator [Bacteroidota bacterium]|nr:helix-turn-helix transcriptional regulator [Bacteroidota bacterium]